MSSSFSIADAAAICVETFLRREQQAEAIRREAARAERRRSRGVAWAGLGEPPRGPGRDDAAIERDARIAEQRAAAFSASPRGRFLAAVTRLERAGDTRAAAARAAYDRGFADPDRVASLAELACALDALAGADCHEARLACLALTEILGAALAVAAE